MIKNWMIGIVFLSERPRKPGIAILLVVNVGGGCIWNYNLRKWLVVKGLLRYNLTNGGLPEMRIGHVEDIGAVGFKNFFLLESEHYFG